MSTIIDCTGLVCPEPVIKTKDILDNTTEGVIEVVVDNEASKSNVERFGRSQGCTVQVTTKGDRHHIIITKAAGATPAAGAMPAEDYTCVPPDRGIVYVIPSDSMGRGEEELGKVLIRAFIKTIKEVTPLPEKIFFYNTGVRLTATDSDLIKPLQDLEAQGVVIFSCGTCLDFLNLKDKLQVGAVTNMYEIMDSMTKAAKVVSPM